MLEPYIRTGLKGVNGVYQAKFRTPQRLGIFKFSVEHSRHGLSHLHLDDEVSIIQWRAQDISWARIYKAGEIYSGGYLAHCACVVLPLSLKIKC